MAKRTQSIEFIDENGGGPGRSLAEKVSGQN